MGKYVRKASVFYSLFIAALLFSQVSRAITRPFDCNLALSTIDNKASAKEMFALAGFPFLMHETSDENVTSMIKLGVILPYKDVPEWVPPITAIANEKEARDKVFTDVLDFAAPPPVDSHWWYSPSLANLNELLPNEPKLGVRFVGGLRYHYWSRVMEVRIRRPILVIDLRALEEFKWHISTGSFNGKYSPELSPKESWGGYRQSVGSWEKDKLREFLLNGVIGEVPFYGPLPFSFVKAIWIHPNIRANLLATLVGDGITEINGKSIEEFVISPRNTNDMKIEKFGGALVR